ncbi:MAG: arginine--tRNA ligase [Candidatus Nomurabacteria bacterium]|jgi:arginyl-tRNA synthetase|nr:arginine--tRNA ligase [Candidatus Nomurabacteria bacterium]
MQAIVDLVEKAVKKLGWKAAAVEVSRTEAQFGDYSTNVAMLLASSVGENPRAIAEKLAAELSGNEFFNSVEVAGAGFINFRLSDAALAREVKSINAEPDRYGASKLYAGKVVVSEFSDPNPFKVLHVGHLYTSVIGDAISNIVAAAGGQVHRVNFGGDVGLHVAKTMWAIIQDLGGELPEKLADIPVEERSEWMGRCYVTGTRTYEDDAVAKETITENNRKIYNLHREDDHDSPFAQIYWTCRGWSYEYFDAFYARIGVKFEKYYPESEIAEVGLKTVLAQRDKGVYEDSDGAVIFNGEKYGLHTRVFINSNGIPIYEAKDVGLAIKKWDDYHFDKSIILTDAEQTDYMKVVMKSMEQYMPESVARTLHLTHGTVKLPGAEKMSSRKGNFLRAVDVIDMVAGEYKKAQGRTSDELVLGAIKYAFLKNRLGPNLSFDPETSVSMHGNSGPYLQYAAVRANAILQKIGEFEAVEINDLDEQERSLVVKLTEFSSVVDGATTELAPQVLCTYLYELAQVFNRFYENSPVANSPRSAIRAQLVQAYGYILRRGLNLLGITVPKKM